MNRYELITGRKKITLSLMVEVLVNRVNQFGTSLKEKFKKMPTKTRNILLVCQSLIPISIIILPVFLPIPTKSLPITITHKASTTKNGKPCYFVEYQKNKKIVQTEVTGTYYDKCEIGIPTNIEVNSNNIITCGILFIISSAIGAFLILKYYKIE